jgi:hypothetical protein
MSGARATRVHFRKSSEAVACSLILFRRDFVGVKCTALDQTRGTRSKIMLCIPSEMSKRKGRRERIDEESITKKQIVFSAHSIDTGKANSCFHSIFITKMYYVRICCSN